MSSKIVRMLMRSTDPSNDDQRNEALTQNAKLKKKEQPHKTASADSVKAEDLVALQIDKMLMLDTVESNCDEKILKPLSKKRRTKEISKAPAAAAIVTNCRGSHATRTIIPTFNKRREEKEKKESYFKKMAKKLQREEKESKKKRKRKDNWSGTQEK